MSKQHVGKKAMGVPKTMIAESVRQRQNADLAAKAKRIAKDDLHFQLPPGPIEPQLESHLFLTQDEAFNRLEEIKKEVEWV